ncbi:MAG TPA: DegT/DnrJ/EryC1/StrS family aminotransferase [Rhodocyclaceae bacterium]|nr:DegT/DnrJ/EryC1/StrS family aminotransferase [Rhodocyclaceae bacterium]
MQADGLREIPPTAGLPLRLRDLLPPWQSDFAQQAAKFLRVDAAGLECSGTACLIVILRALQELSGRRTVVVPAYTCPLVALAIAHCGLQLRLCDLALDSFELDPAALAAACDDDTLAVIPTHLAGRVADLSEVLTIAHRHNAFVIEDAAQCFGARRDNASVGLQGDAGFFSFAAGKGLSLYEGGLWIARTPEMRKAIARVSASVPASFAMEIYRCLQLAGYTAFYRPLPLRFVYGMPLRRALRRRDPVTAAGDDFSTPIPLHRVGAWRRAVGNRALRRLTDFQIALAAQASERLPSLTRLPGVKVFTDTPGVQGVWPLFLILMPTRAMRDAALDRLWGAGVGVTRMFIHALPDYAYLRSRISPADVYVPNAHDFAARAMTISNSLWLDDQRFARIVQILEETISR